MRARMVVSSIATMVVIALMMACGGTAAASPGAAAESSQAQSTALRGLIGDRLKARGAEVLVAGYLVAHVAHEVKGAGEETVADAAGFGDLLGDLPSGGEQAPAQAKATAASGARAVLDEWISLVSRLGVIAPGPEADAIQHRIAELESPLREKVVPLLTTLGDKAGKLGRVGAKLNQDLNVALAVARYLHSYILELYKFLGVFNTALDQMNAALSESIAGMEKMQSALADLNQTMQTSISAVEQINNGLANANAGLNQMLSGQKSVVDGLRIANEGLAKINASVDAIRATAADMAKAAETLQRIQLVGFRIESISEAFGNPQPLLSQDEVSRRFSVLLGLIPWLGNAKGLVEAVSGRDVITGGDLSGLDRAAGALGFLRHANDLKSGAKQLFGQEAIDAAVRASEDAAAAAEFDRGLDRAAAETSVYEPVRYRVKLRKQTQRDIIRNADRTPNGDLICACSGDLIPAKRHADGSPVLIDPATGRPSPTGMTVPVAGKFNFGHKAGREWWRYKAEAEAGGYDRRKVIEDQNDPNRYQLETPEANRSHRCEQAPPQ
ncbi:GH-E family nuclease [Amycolatopsis sp. NPDC054798]